jgi:hypothetical protein
LRVYHAMSIAGLAATPRFAKNITEKQHNASLPCPLSIG